MRQQSSSAILVGEIVLIGFAVFVAAALAFILVMARRLS